MVKVVQLLNDLDFECDLITGPITIQIPDRAIWFMEFLCILSPVFWSRKPDTLCVCYSHGHWHNGQEFSWSN